MLKKKYGECLVRSMGLTYKYYLDSTKMKQCTQKKGLILFYIVTGNLSTTAFCPSNVK